MEMGDAMAREEIGVAAIEGDLQSSLDWLRHVDRSREYISRFWGIEEDLR